MWEYTRAFLVVLIIAMSVWSASFFLIWVSGVSPLPGQEPKEYCAVCVAKETGQKEQFCDSSAVECFHFIEWFLYGNDSVTFTCKVEGKFGIW